MAGDAEQAAEDFKHALSRWASTVTVVAVRDDDGVVHATTVTSFAPVSAHPPQVVVSLSPNAQVLPFVEAGGTVAISLLAEGQRKWASIFSDSFPVGPSPWPEEGPPLIDGGVAALMCTVLEIHATEGESRILLCRVDDAKAGPDERPLLYWQRGYRGLDPD